MQRQQLVQTLFNRIAHRYDLLNRIISFRCDVRWREKTVKFLRSSDRLILDLGTGTGDLALTAAKRLGSEAKIFGLDFSLEMLRLAQKKKEDYYGNKIVYILGTALDPPFKNDAFNAVMTGFVLRNIPDLALFFLQAFRVLKPGGRLISLDMFPPTNAPFSFLYSLYFYRLVPWIGASLAHDRNAYQYLADSVRTFDPPETVASMIQQAGFVGVRIERFLKGAVCLHIGEKPPARFP